METSIEIWKFVDNSLYQISNFGNIRRKYKNRDEYKPVKGEVSRHGYRNLHLRIPKSKHVYIHKFVAENFIGEIPKDYVVHHIDEDIKNNHVDNLQIMSRKEHQSMNHNSNKRKLSMEDARIIRKLYYIACKSVNDICRIYHYVSPATINHIKNCIDGYYEDFDDPIYDAVYYADEPEIVNTRDYGRVMAWRHPEEYKEWKESLKKIA